MNSLFSIITLQGGQLLVFQPWWDDGIRHGMTLGPRSFKGESLSGDAAWICRSMGASHLALLHQTHSDTVVDLRVREQIAQDLREYGDLMKRREGDAVLLARQDEGEMQIAAGVMTADCVPIVVRSRDEWALIHAGWRGLANGIITKALKCLKGDIREAAVFAAAGPPEYEVGEEVIAAIGSPAVFTSTSAGRFALDTAATAAKQLGSFAPNAAIAVAGISTITDKRFHSYRRNGEAAGRSVTFVVPPPTLKEQG